MLSAEGLRKAFRRGRGVVDVGLRLGTGEIVGLLGSNGAGKTTTFRMLTGDVVPDAGIVRLDGRDVSRWPLKRRVREGGLGYLPQEPSLFSDLTTEDNLLTILSARGVDATTRRRQVADLLLRFDLDGQKHVLAHDLSGGRRRRLELARCLIGEPRVILLDEPFNGVDPLNVDELQRLIRELRREGTSFLISDHKVTETLQLVDRAYVMHEGKVLFAGTPRELIDDPLVRCHYLGLRPPVHRPPIRSAA